MKHAAALIALAVPLLGIPAHASPELAAKSQCMICHQIDKKAMGPSFKDIAARYKSDSAAEATLVNSMLKGAAGKWGKAPMPPQKIAPVDAQKLTRWILTL